MKIVLLAVLFAFPVDVMPPDLIHVDRPSCTLVQYGVSEVLNAKTGAVEQVNKWRVEPYATYDDHRDRWELPKETLPFSHEERPGALVSVDTGPEALRACEDWMNKVKKAVTEAKRKQPRGKP